MSYINLYYNSNIILKEVIWGHKRI